MCILYSFLRLSNISVLVQVWVINVCKTIKIFTYGYVPICMQHVYFYVALSLIKIPVFRLEWVCFYQGLGSLVRGPLNPPVQSSRLRSLILTICVLQLYTSNARLVALSLETSWSVDRTRGSPSRGWMHTHAVYPALCVRGLLLILSFALSVCQLTGRHRWSA